MGIVYLMMSNADMALKRIDFLNNFQDKDHKLESEDKSL